MEERSRGGQEGAGVSEKDTIKWEKFGILSKHVFRNDIASFSGTRYNTEGEYFW